MFTHLLARRAATTTDTSLKDVLERHPGIISFAGGLPDERAFDLATLREIAAEVAADPLCWQYAPTEGLMALREALSASARADGIVAGPDEVLITEGSQQGLDLCARLLIEPGDAVLIEAPGYIGALRAFENAEARIIGVPLDDDGLCVDRLAELARRHRPKLLYTAPTFQNPTGTTLPLERRRRVLEIAAECGFLVLEDHAYRAIRFEGEEIPPLKALPGGERVIYAGSFSKALVPGVRVGWLIADAELIRHMALLKQGTDLAGNTFGQRLVLRWLETRKIEPPIALYRQKRDQTLRALAAHLRGDVHWNRPQGGFFLWVRLGPGGDSRTLLTLAKREGVSFVPGPSFGGEAAGFRFSYSQVPLEAIDEGVRRLAAAVALLREADGAAGPQAAAG
ncbi:MAG TPA: PLP-dependent aminotransferase family protein [Limnochordia bacterium]